MAYALFDVTIRGAKGCLPLLTLQYVHQAVGAMEVQFHEYLAFTSLFKSFWQQVQRIQIFDSDLVQARIIDAWSALPLFSKKKKQGQANYEG